MRSYQVVLVVKSGSEASRKKAVDAVKAMLKGLKVTKEEDLGSKALSYKINGEQSAHYVDMVVEGDMPSDFEKKVMENNDILRHLVLRKS